VKESVGKDAPPPDDIFSSIIRKQVNKRIAVSVSQCPVHKN
jgi:hypothetical protein